MSADVPIEIGAALAVARGSGLKASARQRPLPGEIHEPGWEVYVRDGESTWMDFVPYRESGTFEERAERSVRMCMERLTTARNSKQVKS